MILAVEVIDRQKLPPGDRQCIGNLRHRTWPASPSSEPRFASAPPLDIDWPAAQQAQFHLIRDQGVIIAVACSVPRRVRCGEQDLDVLALEGVVCQPDYRGQGLGAAVVRSAFQRVDRGAFRLSLFQTAVPGFYQKLGCSTVEVPLVNSHSTVDRSQCPFWEPWLMVYPTGFAFPGGAIDTLGPGW